MPRYIDADTLKTALRKLVDESDCNIAIMPDVFEVIGNQPIADDKEGVRGENVSELNLVDGFERENPTPLTYEQLKQRVGKPVYTVYNNSYDENVWGVVRVVGNTISIHSPWRIILPRENENRMRFYDYELKEELSCKPHQEE